MICPNCSSTRHALCCARCGRRVRPSRAYGGCYCSRRCARDQAREDELSAAIEEARS